MQNEDTNEGRGPILPIYISECKTTAIRLAYRRDVQGANCQILEKFSLNVEGIEYFPMKFVPIIRPTLQDLEEEKKLIEEREIRERKAKLSQKLKEVGISEEDLKFLNLK